MTKWAVIETNTFSGAIRPVIMSEHRWRWSAERAARRAQARVGAIGTRAGLRYQVKKIEYPPGAKPRGKKVES